MKLEDLKCEFCEGSGEFSRDNSDGIAVEGECSFCEGTGIHENYRDFINTVERASSIDANSIEERMSEASHYDWLDEQNEKMKKILFGIIALKPILYSTDEYYSKPEHQGEFEAVCNMFDDIENILKEV